MGLFLGEFPPSLQQPLTSCSSSSRDTALGAFTPELLCQLVWSYFRSCLHGRFVESSCGQHQCHVKETLSSSRCPSLLALTLLLPPLLQCLDFFHLLIINYFVLEAGTLSIDRQGRSSPCGPNSPQTLKTHDSFVSNVQLHGWQEFAMAASGKCVAFLEISRVSEMQPRRFVHTVGAMVGTIEGSLGNSRVTGGIKAVKQIRS